MNRQIILTLTLALIFCGLSFAAEKTAVFDFECIGIDPGTGEAASHIFRNELEATGKYTVLARTEMESQLAAKGFDDPTCHAVGCASDYGYALGVGSVIIGSLTKLGGRITAEVRMISVVDKKVVFSDRFPANSVDDLDASLRKLANAVASRDKIESEIDRFAITEEETQDSRRKKGYITSGAMFGFGFPLGKSYSGVSDLVSFSWVMRYEAGNYVLENSLGFSSGSGGEQDTTLGLIEDKLQVAVLFWDIGLKYVVNRGADFSPFFGGGLGLHFVASQESQDYVYTKDARAFALHLSGGLYAFQSYNFRLTVEGKYTMLFTDVFYDSGNSSHQIGISIGITRKFEKGEKRGCMSGGCIF